MRRRFEFQEGTSNKFWEIEINETAVSTFWGRIGSSGQNKVKDYGTKEKARKEYDKLIEEKTTKGYVEKTEQELPVSVTAKNMGEALAMAEAEAIQSRAKNLQTVSEDNGDDDDAGNGSFRAGPRRFEYEEGNSSKFWEIEIDLDDCSLTTSWGKIGSEGSSKTLEFDSEDEAIKHYDKLVAEKVKKGYEEVGSNDDGDDDSGFEIPDNWKPFKRKAWKPVTEAGDGDLKASKFSGIPWLGQGESWPDCECCQKPMQLFLQLNLATLPQDLAKKFGKGLIQLFYCIDSNCEDSEESYLGNDTSMRVRLLSPDGDSASPSESPCEDAFPPRLIRSWAPLPTEYPNFEELSVCHGIEVDEDLLDELEDVAFSYDGDKLYGWPSWVQGVEYGECEICSQQMELVFQIGSEDNLPYMFGDCGIGHISQCPSHPDQFKFGWACS